MVALIEKPNGRKAVQIGDLVVYEGEPGIDCLETFLGLARAEGNPGKAAEYEVALGLLQGLMGDTQEGDVP